MVKTNFKIICVNKNSEKRKDAASPKPGDKQEEWSASK